MSANITINSQALALRLMKSWLCYKWLGQLEPGLRRVRRQGGGAHSNGTLQMAISPSSPATVTSPTATSTTAKILTPGAPMPLANITTEEDRLCRNW
jgi:hypothetical protein